MNLLGRFAWMLLVMIVYGTAGSAEESVCQPQSGEIQIPAGRVSLAANTVESAPKLGQLLEQSNAAIAANPNDLAAIVDRGEVRLASGDGASACTDALAVLNAHDVPDQTKSRAVLVAHFGYLRSGKTAEGAAILLQSRDLCKHDVWPYPIIACLLGDISEQQMMDGANSDRASEQEARLFLAYRDTLTGKSQAAWQHFEWVERNASHFMQQIAFAELKRLDPSHVLTIVDYHDYTAKLQDKLKSLWHPPDEVDQTGEVTVAFKVHADGKVSHLIITKTSGSSKLDDTGIKAVESASPFAPLPKGSPDDVDVGFSFERNVVK